MPTTAGFFAGIRSFVRCACQAALGILLCGLLSAAPAQDSATDFDHDQTGFPLDFKHALEPCESCHLQGIFAGTPRRCVDCHSHGGRIRASAAPADHIRVIGDCDYCHRADSWRIVARVDHAAVVGSCANCHNGVISTGKHPGHVPSSNFCDDCHTTFNWKFYHVNISSNCVFCHNGGTAEGKNPAHIPSTNSCEDCHRTSDWSPVRRVDHNSVLGTCFSCHNGVIARGKGPAHVPSSDDCALCHRVTAWTPAFP